MFVPTPPPPPPKSNETHVSCWPSTGYRNGGGGGGLPLMCGKEKKRHVHVVKQTLGLVSKKKDKRKKSKNTHTHTHTHTHKDDVKSFTTIHTPRNMFFRAREREREMQRKYIWGLFNYLSIFSNNLKLIHTLI